MGHLARVDVNLFYIDLDYCVKSASCAPVIRGKSAEFSSKIWCGVPAAAQMVSNSNRRGSKKARIGFRCPTGATPPMAKPVCARISAASALPSSSPATALALAASTILPPAVRNRIASPLVSPRKMMDLVIWSNAHPAASAACWAVRATPSSLISVSIPRSSSALRTRFMLLLIPYLRNLCALFPCFAPLTSPRRRSNVRP